MTIGRQKLHQPNQDVPEAIDGFHVLLFGRARGDQPKPWLNGTDRISNPFPDRPVCLKEYENREQSSLLDAAGFVKSRRGHRGLLIDQFKIGSGRFRDNNIQCLWVFGLFVSKPRNMPTPSGASEVISR